MGIDEHVGQPCGNLAPFINSGLLDANKRMSIGEIERVTRKFISRIHNILGPYRDVPAPDVNTNQRVMAWIMDEYSSRHGYTPACVTGKPVELGGSLGRKQATGRGVMLVLKKYLNDIHRSPRGMRVAIQGFGNVGSHAAILLQEEGAEVFAVSDMYGAIIGRNGMIEAPRALILGAGNRAPEALIVVVDADGRRSEEVLEPFNQYRGLVEAFAASILSNSPVPLPLSESINNARALDAFARSAAEGRRIKSSAPSMGG